LSLQKLDIKVEGQSLDILQGEEKRFFVNKAIHNLSNLQTRDADSVRAITIPRTSRNLTILGQNIPSRSRFNTLPIQNIDCEVFVGGISLIQDAYLVIGSETREEINISLFGGASKFFALLQDRPIGEMTWADLNFELTLDGITDLVTATDTMVYPDTQWYDNPSRRIFDELTLTRIDLERTELGESGVYIYLEEVLDRIFNNMELTVDKSGLDLVFRESAFAVSIPIIHESFEGIEGGFSYVNETGLSLADTGGGNTKINYDLTGADDLWSVPNQRYEFVEDGFWQVALTFQGETRRTDSLIFELTGLVGGVAFSRVTVVNPTQNQTIPFDVSIGTTVNVESGDFLEVFYEMVGGDPATLDNSDFIIQKQGAGRGRTVDIGLFLPEITQKDFVLEVFKVFNIIATERQNTVTLSYWEDIKTADRTQQLRIDVAQKLDVNATFPTYGQQSDVIYSPNDAVERLDADDFFLVNALTLIKRRTMIELAFSATDQAASQGDGSTDRVCIPSYKVAYRQIGDNKLSYFSGGPSDDLVTKDANGLQAGDFIFIEDQVDQNRVVHVSSDKRFQIDTIITVTNDRDWDAWRYNKENLHPLHIARIKTSGPLIVADGRESRAYLTASQATFESELTWTGLLDVYYNVLVKSVNKPFIFQAFVNIKIIFGCNISFLNYLIVNNLQHIKILW